MSWGWLTLARPAGIPVRAHWSVPVGAVAFAGLHVRPWEWLGFPLLVLLHEVGHAAVVVLLRLRVRRLELTGIGGTCHWSGYATPLQRSAVAWGGVAAQGLGIGLASLLSAVFGEPRSEAGAQLMNVFVGTSLSMVAVNLLPVQPLDGAEAWLAIPLLWQRLRSNSAWRRRRLRRRLARLHDRDELEGNPDAFADEAKEMLRKLRDEAAAGGQGGQGGPRKTKEPGR